MAIEIFGDTHLFEMEMRGISWNGGEEYKFSNCALPFKSSLVDLEVLTPSQCFIEILELALTAEAGRSWYKIKMSQK